ncbi:MAG: DUF1726 domain-containing protein, partial [Candidatus Nitrosothermus koennekii]
MAMDELLRMIDKASSYRILFYITNRTLGKGKVSRLVDLYANNRIVVVYRDREDATTRLLLEELYDIKREEYLFDDANKLLGSTCDVLIADLTNYISPNKLGILVELVRGGGIIILVAPRKEEIDSWFTDFHKEFATKEDIKLRFE